MRERKELSHSRINCAFYYRNKKSNYKRKRERERANYCHLFSLSLSLPFSSSLPISLDFFCKKTERKKLRESGTKYQVNSSSLSFISSFSFFIPHFSFLSLYSLLSFSLSMTQKISLGNKKKEGKSLGTR